MAVNLVSLVMQFLTPDMIGRIASALGLDRNSTQTAVGAGVPGLLAGLMGVALQPGGGQKLVELPQSSTAAHLETSPACWALGVKPRSSRRDRRCFRRYWAGRTRMRSPERWPSLQGWVRGRVGRCSECLPPWSWARSPSSKARILLMPSGIASLLASQKDNIATALPSGFGNLLGGTGLLDLLGGAARTATGAGSEAARAATTAARAVGDTGRRAAGAASSASPNWLYWLIPAVAIAALLIYLFARPTEQAVQQGVSTAQSLTVGGLDVGKQVTDSVTSLRTTLGGITDGASAQAALPKLQEVSAQINKVDDLLAQLSPEQRKVLAGIVNPLMPTLNQLFDKVLAIPGVAELLKPTIDALKVKLVMLAT